MLLSTRVCVCVCMRASNKAVFQSPGGNRLVMKQNLPMAFLSCATNVKNWLHTLWFLAGGGGVGWGGGGRDHQELDTQEA